MYIEKRHSTLSCPSTKLYFLKTGKQRIEERTYVHTYVGKFCSRVIRLHIDVFLSLIISHSIFNADTGGSIQHNRAGQIG
jgi:hypothetical protein